MNWTLQCGDIRSQVDDRLDLEQQLLRLHEDRRQAPAIAHLCHPDGACLNIALGRQESLLNYLASGGWPARHSVGDVAAQGVVQYAVAGEISEFPSSCLIPFEVALKAALDFYSTGELAEQVRWEDD
jgi:Immunity protein Imm1